MIAAIYARKSSDEGNAVSDFKRRLLEATLTQVGGNRTRAARALGLQRTYLLGNSPPR